MLLIRRDNSDNLGIISHIFSTKTYFMAHHYDLSLEPSCRDANDEGSQHIFLLRNKKKISLDYSQLPFLSGAPILSAKSGFSSVF